MPTGRWSFDINAFGIGWIEINLAGGTTWVWVTRPSWWGYFVGWINIEDHWCCPELHLSEWQFSWSGDITVDSSKCSLLILWYLIEICRHIPRKCLFLSRTMAENVQQSHQTRRWCEVTVSWKLARCMLNRFVSNFLSQSTSWNHIWLPCQWVNGKPLFTSYHDILLYSYILQHESKQSFYICFHTINHHLYSCEPGLGITTASSLSSSGSGSTKGRPKAQFVARQRRARYQFISTTTIFTVDAMDDGSDVVVMRMPCESTFGSCLFLWLNSDTTMCSDRLKEKEKKKYIRK